MLYLGYLVSAGKYEVPPERLALLSKIPRPRNNEELRRALGRLGDARNAVPHYSLLAAPMSDAMRKGRKLVWTAELTEAWTALVRAVADAVALFEPVDGVALHLAADASDFAIWWAFYQLL